MNLPLEAIPVPLREDGHGELRVGQSRVSLESVWHLHQQGGSPADIVGAFDTLPLADVHAVLAWALRHTGKEPAMLRLLTDEDFDGRRDGRLAGSDYLCPTLKQTSAIDSERDTA